MRIIVAILALQFGASTGLAQAVRESDDTLAARIHRIESSLLPSKFKIAGEPSRKVSIGDRLRELSIPGLSIAVVNQGAIEWAKGYGLADVAEARKVDVDTLFLAGSISKPVAALRVLQLAEGDKLDLDADVDNYLRNWQIPDNGFTAKEKVTLRRILNHTAGLTVHGFPGYSRGDEIPSVIDVLNGNGNTGPVRVFQEPGKAWRYSGGGYTVMQLLLTDVEATEFHVIMQENVLHPLQMTSSTFENPLPDKFHAIAATGYRANGNEVDGKWPIYPEMAAAGLWTTPSQLIQYAIEIQQIVRTGADGVLTAKSVQNMLQPGLNGHGLGPVITEHWFGHGGADRGFRARLVAWNDTESAVVAMVNSDNGQILDEVLRAVADEYGLPGFALPVKSMIELPESERNRFAGAYTLPNGVEVSVVVEGQGLVLRMGEESRTFLPEVENQFFDQEAGVTIRFQLEGDTVTGFKALERKIEARKTRTPE